MNKRTDRAGTRRALSFLPALIIFSAALIVLGSCADPVGWYPSGTVTVAGTYESDDVGVRSLVVTATIENTGISTISRSTFTITAVTDARTYWNTVTSETRVLPGAKIKVTGVIDYLGSAEILKAEGLVIGDVFFE